MDEELKDNGSRKISGKTILIIAALIIVLGAGAGVGLVKASDYPEFCNACHIMRSYYQSWSDGDLLAKKHADAKLKCHDCHQAAITEQAREGVLFVTGSYEDPLKKRQFPREFCLRCHTDFDAVKAKTNFEESNPHDSHNGEQNCYECHSMHRQSQVMCAQCHQFNWMDELDGSWKKK